MHTLKNLNQDEVADQHLANAHRLPERLLSGFGVVSIGLRHQGCDECTEQGFAPTAGVVNELEEAEIDGQLLL